MEFILLVPRLPFDVPIIIVLKSKPVQLLFFTTDQVTDHVALIHFPQSVLDRALSLGGTTPAQKNQQQEDFFHGESLLKMAFEFMSYYGKYKTFLREFTNRDKKSFPRWGWARKGFTTRELTVKADLGLNIRPLLGKFEALLPQITQAILLIAIAKSLLVLGLCRLFLGFFGNRPGLPLHRQ